VRDTNRDCLRAGCAAVEHGIDEGDWRKASYSLGNGECIEVAASLSGGVGVRDSKNLAGSILVCSAEQWKSFLANIKV
jgi:hypothetical protein